MSDVLCIRNKKRSVDKTLILRMKKASMLFELQVIVMVFVT